MQFSVISTITALLALSLGADARIESALAPPTIKVGEGFNVKLEGFPYIQSVHHISFAIGAKPQPANTASIGQRLGSYYLGDEQSNVVGNVTKWVPVPANFPKGPTTLIIALNSLYGADALPVTEKFAINVNFGDTPTSNTYVRGTYAP